jgi:CheY-like chemotaxis protein
VKPNVEFRTICATDGRDWVLGDSHRIQQVMTNVITNAIKYTITGSITLSIRWIDDFVCFTCDDTGPGIPKSDQAYLFERYVQRGGAPGTGLGLAIAKHLVTLFHGSIQFESDPRIKPGTSCIVMMRLQQCPPPDAFIQTSEDVLDSELSFLIVDDITLNRTMLKRRILKGIAPKSIVKEAATGEEALLICGSEKFDVIVVDQYMDEAGGVMVGTDVVFAMRRIRIDSIIVGCSGNDIDDQFLEAGADWVWKKPLPSNSVIISQLRRGLSNKI